MSKDDVLLLRDADLVWKQGSGLHHAVVARACVRVVRRRVVEAQPQPKGPCTLGKRSLWTENPPQHAIRMCVRTPRVVCSAAKGIIMVDLAYAGGG